MNTNLWRTILGALSGGGVLLTIARLAGCEIDDPATPIVEATSCAGSTLLAGISPIATMAGTFILMIVAGLLKMAREGSTAVDNLTKPTAVLDTTGKIGTAVKVVAPVDSGPGVVTPAQVHAK